MYVKVQSIRGKSSSVIPVSRTAKVPELKLLVEATFHVHPSKQRLFFRGKELVDDHALFDYGININDVVQLVEKPGPSSEEETHVSAKESEQSAAGGSRTIVEATSDYFRMGDLVDMFDRSVGAWFEGQVVFICMSNKLKVGEEDDGLIYYVKLRNGDIIEESLKNIRPRARSWCNTSTLKIGDRVLANYNVNTPHERGFWYECVITRIRKLPMGVPEVFVTVLFGETKSPLKDVQLRFCKDIMKLEERKLLIDCHETLVDIVPRVSAPYCPDCCDDPLINCQECGCHVCGGKDRRNEILICDDCDFGYHLKCLTPPLESVPECEDWYCPGCKINCDEIVKAGEKLKVSRKRAHLVSQKKTCSRDWGKGMACVGRTSVCTIVPNNHYGPIPGVEVGSLWKFRLQVSEAGVHRPHVAGIHGSEHDGAYSIVLSGGYEDDVDKGDSFVYTGSGGRDLSGNRRTAQQSYDQTLTRMNKALALNCNAPLNEKGAKAKDWKKGKPVRVVRNCKARGQSKYAPEDGNRYDGIYKVVEYYPQKGKSGFIVWRFVLRRDDPTPAPWTKEGKKHCERLGLKMIYPEGYLEAMGGLLVGQKSQRRVPEDNSESSDRKRVKLEPFLLEKRMTDMIKKDKLNEKVWNICMKSLQDGKQKFFSTVCEQFLCICCQELVLSPVTTDCKHNMCLTCLKSSFTAEIYCCPCCRHELGSDYHMTVNENLSLILLKLFPGYGSGR